MCDGSCILQGWEECGERRNEQLELLCKQVLKMSSVCLRNSVGTRLVNCSKDFSFHVFECHVMTRNISSAVVSHVCRIHLLHPHGNFCLHVLFPVNFLIYTEFLLHFYPFWFTKYYSLDLFILPHCNVQTLKHLFFLSFFLYLQ